MRGDGVRGVKERKTGHPGDGCQSSEVLSVSWFVDWQGSRHAELGNDLTKVL